MTSIIDKMKESLSLCPAIERTKLLIAMRCDVRNLQLPENSVDVVITDPPYGAATKEDKESLVNIWKSFLEISLRVLRNNGRLVFCVMEKERRGSPVIITPDKAIETAKSIAKALKLHPGMTGNYPLSSVLHAEGKG